MTPYEKAERYLNLAKYVATEWSKDPSGKIGAVGLVNGSQPIVGYNGFPRKMADTPERLNDREDKYRRTIHAEMNVIYNAAELGVSLRGAELFVYGLPICDNCALGIAQAGVTKVYLDPEYIFDETRATREKWRTAFNDYSLPTLLECGVEVFYIDRVRGLLKQLKQGDKL